MTFLPPREPRYQAYYCEENVWWLCREAVTAAVACRVVFISNAERRVLLEQQRAHGSGRVVWDYHVILLVADGAAAVWDLDTRLGVPCPARTYFDRTFPTAAPPDLRPQFRVVDGARFLATFSTDRRHMRTPDGGWTQPPPAWAPPQATGSAHNLERFVDVSAPFEGELLDRAAMVERFG